MRYTIILTLALIIIPEVEAMSIFDVGKTCVFSAVKVRLLHKGKPVSNAKVTRQWEWNKRNYDESVTNDDGYVLFPATFESSLSRLFPTELVIGQQLSVQINGEEKVFWTNSKREPEENAEYGGVKFQVVCELSDEEKLIEDYGSLMVTVCKLETGGG
jgi:hypothetical protein